MNGDKEKPPRNLPISPERNLPWTKLLKKLKLLLPLNKLLLKSLLPLKLKLNKLPLLPPPNNKKRNERIKKIE
jgi:hypothetical protein